MLSANCRVRAVTTMVFGARLFVLVVQICSKMNRNRSKASESLRGKFENFHRGWMDKEKSLLTEHNFAFFAGEIHFP